ncbi:hypothetical protein Daura_15080 [Dactylosporangium aurantiacum]|uniref:Uncharacterized protein n=1 Tax=Dactylosporangium aurantiacum TaxID=35754 RepID=A0A9Q9IM00_9ACTN|nr:hypothetical protein [Dactylosporangium aurantiacum]MDG6108446.1 hypothetical protein [Dactylosporangium aurantiacum]UWZ57363.1 hypothetical protein Daura_15080 [Dactylosporangium aurantiacum]
MSKVVRFGISIVVLLVLAGIGWYLNRDSAENAKVGDCLHEVKANELKIVECGGADAQYSVVGKVGNQDASVARDPNTTVCQAFPEATGLYWWGESGKKGDVLCFKEIKAA